MIPFRSQGSLIFGVNALTYINPLWIAQAGPQRRKSGLDAVVRPWHVYKNIRRTFERFYVLSFPNPVES